MIGWREGLWFRFVALIVVVMLAGGFARVVLGFALEAAAANRGAAVVAAAVLFGFSVRAAMRRFRVEPERRHHMRLVERDEHEASSDDVADLERLFLDSPEEPTQE
jgi:hypothetical protein